MSSDLILLLKFLYSYYDWCTCALEVDLPPTSIVGRAASHHAPPQRCPQLPWPILLFQMSDGDPHPRWWATTYPLQHVSCLGQASPPRAWPDKLWRCRANGLGDWVESTYYKTIERKFSWLLFTREGDLRCRDECSCVAGTGFILNFLLCVIYSYSDPIIDKGILTGGTGACTE
jgi:hypothetical protein